MTQKLILMVYFGLLIAFSNGTNIFNTKFDKDTQKPTNLIIPRKNTGDPFKFPKHRPDPPGTALCPAKLPIFCSNYNSKTFLCVEHDKAVFNGLNTDDDRQTVTFSQKDGYTSLFIDDEELLCRSAPNKTNLTIEDFKAVNNIGILGQLERNMIEKLKDIEGDPIAVCEVSNSEQVRYFRYDEDDKAYKYMVKFTTKKFHINGTLYSLSCYQGTTDRTAKEVLEQSVKDRLKLEAGENGQQGTVEVKPASSNADDDPPIKTIIFLAMVQLGIIIWYWYCHEEKLDNNSHKEEEENDRSNYM